MDRYKYTICDALYDLADRHGISIYKIVLKPETPDVASLTDDSVVINVNFGSPVNFNYRLAHELSHILYGDRDAQAVYYFSEYGKRGEELLAHRNAIKMLMSIEMPTTVNGFMEYYHVPSWLEQYANETFKSLSVVE